MKKTATKSEVVRQGGMKVSKCQGQIKYISVLVLLSSLRCFSSYLQVMDPFSVQSVSSVPPCPLDMVIKSQYFMGRGDCSEFDLVTTCQCMRLTEGNNDRKNRAEGNE